MEDIKQKFLEAVDADASYCFAKKMETYRTNPVFGFRTAGSEAERMTGEIIREEMERIGLSDIHRDEVQLDSWELKKAVLRYEDRDGRSFEFQLGAYQTDFRTEGFQEFSMVYLGKGTAAEYEGRDVKGKIVLVDINQRDVGWINFPVYQAHLKGAAALIAVQENGYGEIDDASLNAQDIAGPADAPAFSMSRADAAVLKEAMKEQSEITVSFEADSSVRKDQLSYNIWGAIPGEEEDNKILLTAHYDSYCNGFQDDNSAVAMILGIAQAFLKIGYRPKKTIVFCAMAAEEWGIEDSKYDWSAGAWQQVFKIRPQWQGEVMANLSFELPAHAHGRKGTVRGTYEYYGFLKDFLNHLPDELDVTSVYPEGIEVREPVETWSDDFSITISGIPSMVNKLSAGSLMETHYHSRFDNDNCCDEDVYRFNHKLFGLLVMAFDELSVAPVNLKRLFQAVRRSIKPVTGREDQECLRRLMDRLDEAEIMGDRLYRRVCALNRKEEKISRCERMNLQRRLLRLFRRGQDSFGRLDWKDCVLFPQEAVQNNLRHLRKAAEELEQLDGAEALKAIYQIDNNSYAFQFDEEVFRRFTEYVLSQKKDRLQWGAGRIVRHENMFSVAAGLKYKVKHGQTNFTEERNILKAVEEKQQICYDDDIRYMVQAVGGMIDDMKKA